jgi:uncharacterized coiled-coil protein SlyX
MATQVNPFSALMRMLETRIARQKDALAESELQLVATRESFMKHEEETKQTDAFAKAKK